MVCPEVVEQGFRAMEVAGAGYEVGELGDPVTDHQIGLADLVSGVEVDVPPIHGGDELDAIAEHPFREQWDFVDRSVHDERL